MKFKGMIEFEIKDDLMDMEGDKEFFKDRLTKLRDCLKDIYMRDGAVTFLDFWNDLNDTLFINDKNKRRNPFGDKHLDV